ncbi:MAG: SRPBCC domain-containing protein [Pyrinomonadaceae bacterium]|nr:SRPBCC domain-containing protein [Sphingobacteriaceae bacterium]
MEKQIKKSIEITATKEKIWEVLLQDKFTRIWYAEFSEGTYAETDWKLESKVVFKDATNCGLIGKIVVNRPFEVISVEYTGILTNGIEDTKSSDAKSMSGGRETYRLTEIGTNTTQLNIECDMAEEYFGMMSAAWDKALEKIKNLSEN